MPKKAAKKSAKSTAKRPVRKSKAAPAEAVYPKTTCGEFYLVPQGDGTAREVPVGSVTG